MNTSESKGASTPQQKTDASIKDFNSNRAANAASRAAGPHVGVEVGVTPLRYGESVGINAEGQVVVRRTNADGNRVESQVFAGDYPDAVAFDSDDADSA